MGMVLVLEASLVSCAVQLAHLHSSLGQLRCLTVTPVAEHQSQGSRGSSV